ncbi:MAG TPA: hypothetical protein VFS08_15385 [Gemmatimonadaceae bacterium]|nr:hypothetical protein [Gemmatimonadaceae bacterium]
MLSRPARRALALALVPLAACAGGDDADSDSLAADSTGAATPTAAADPAASGSAAAAALSEADLDAYERALDAEVAVLRDVQARMAAAKTNEDSTNALFAAAQTETEPAAAQRAGIDVDRYRRLDQVFGTALGARQMNPGLRAMMSNVDTAYLKDLPADQAAEQRERLRQNAQEAQAAFSDSATYRTVPPELVDALKARADARLDSLWKERFALRARIAGLGG